MINVHKRHNSKPNEKVFPKEVVIQLPLLITIVTSVHGPSMCAVKTKIYGVYLINPALSLLMKHLVIGQRQRAPNFSAFHWSTHGSLVSFGQHFVTARVAHLPKRTETSLITESDRSGPNHRIGPGCAGRA